MLLLLADGLQHDAHTHHLEMEKTTFGRAQHTVMLLALSSASSRHIICQIDNNAKYTFSSRVGG